MSTYINAICKDVNPPLIHFLMDHHYISICFYYIFYDNPLSTHRPDFDQVLRELAGYVHAPRTHGTHAWQALHLHQRDLGHFQKIAPDGIQRKPSAAERGGIHAHRAHRVAVRIDGYAERARQRDAFLAQHQMRHARAAVEHAHAMRAIKIAPQFLRRRQLHGGRGRSVIGDSENALLQRQLFHAKFIQIGHQLFRVRTIRRENHREHIGFDFDKRAWRHRAAFGARAIRDDLVQRVHFGLERHWSILQRNIRNYFFYLYYSATKI